MKASPTSPKGFRTQLRVGIGLARFILRATLRNRAGYFFSMVFPLVFVITFGLFSDQDLSVRLGVTPAAERAGQAYDAVATAAAQPESGVRLVTGGQDELERMLAQGQIAGMLVPSENTPGQVELVTSVSARQGGAVLRSFISDALGKLSLTSAGIAQPAYRLGTRELPGKRLRHFDYILPGQIGFSMLALATFGIGYNLVNLRKTLVLKRMFATAVRPLTFVVAQGFSRSVQAVLQAAVLIAVGVVAFGATLAHGWLTAGLMLFLALLGVLAFIGFGIAAANASDDEHTISVLLNLFHLPQVLLAGVFFPTESLPRWVRVVGDNLPLSYLNEALRQAAMDGAGLPQLWPYIAGMFVWGVLAYLLAARTFRTE